MSKVGNRAAERRLHIVLFGTFDEGHHPRVRVLREGLAAHGHRLEVVNVPLALDTAGRVALARRPWRAPLFGMQIIATWARLLAGSARTRHPDIVVVGYMGHFDVHLARLRWPRAHLVLDHMVSLADTVKDRRLDRRPGLLRVLTLIDRAALAQADTVLVDTDEQAAELPTRHRSKAVVVLVGAPDAWFDVARSRDPALPMSVIFVGLFTPLQGTPTIGDAIGKLRSSGIAFTMVGTGQDHAAVRAVAGDARVTWLDWVDGDKLPALVSSHDVCLGIFGTGPKAQRVAPNKVFQGAAAGCAIVTSDTPVQRAVLDDAAVYLPAGDPAALADALTRLAEDPARREALRRAALARAEAHFTPAAVVAGLSRGLPRAHDDPMSPVARIEPPLPPNAALRWRVVSSHLRALPATRVLELGSGQGAVGARLASSYEYVGVEPDPTSRLTAGARLPAGARLFDDLDDLGDDERFDLLCSFEVLEHLPDDRGALARWVQQLEPGGHVVVSVPAEPDRFGPADELAGHIRRYTTEDLAALLESAGLEVVAIEHYGFPLGLALETGRNRVARRRLAEEKAPADVATRTAGSGRHMQPPQWSGKAIWWAIAPFHIVQRRFPDRGPGLVGVARLPARTS